MKYAHIDENNLLLGFYDDEINKTIPTPNVQLTVEQWRSLLDNQHNKVNADGTGETVDTRTAEEIAEYNNTQYQRNRASAYPSIQEQLDMQYWDSVNGTTTWADAIAQVKADYPKGAE